jgi:hypothetical protein
VGSIKRTFACLLCLSEIKDDSEKKFAHNGLKIRSKAGKVDVFPLYWMHLHQGISPTNEATCAISFFWAQPAGEESARRKLT